MEQWLPVFGGVAFESYLSFGAIIDDNREYDFGEVVGCPLLTLEVLKYGHEEAEIVFVLLGSIYWDPLAHMSQDLKAD